MKTLLKSTTERLSKQFNRIKNIFKKETSRVFSKKAQLLLVRDLVVRYWTVSVGLIVAIFAFWATQKYAEDRVSEERNRLLPRGGVVEVLVAARDLSIGEAITPVTVAIRKVPREWVLPSTLSPNEFDAIANLTFISSVAAGSPITVEHLRKTETQRVGMQLQPGFRAVSIAVDEVSSVGGLIRPGDFVDLWGSPLPKTPRKSDALVNLGGDTSDHPQTARLIAENLLVLATGQNTDVRDRTSSNTQPNSIGASYSSVTLAVPAKVATLVLAGQFQGRLGVALRSGGEELAQSKKRKSLARPRAPEPVPVEILVGGIDGGEQ